MADVLLGGEHVVGVVQALLAGGRVEEQEGELVVQVNDWLQHIDLHCCHHRIRL